MRQRTLASALIAVALTALIAGCAGPTVGPPTVTPAAFDEQLVGTWNGKFWALGEDRSFTVTVTPTGAANNIAKPGSWFPVFSSLKRSRDGELYGVANDPASGGGDIGFKFEKGDQPMVRGEAIVR
jgi:hypothetical protein